MLRLAHLLFYHHFNVDEKHEDCISPPLGHWPANPRTKIVFELYLTQGQEMCFPQFDIETEYVVVYLPRTYQYMIVIIGPNLRLTLRLYQGNF